MVRQSVRIGLLIGTVAAVAIAAPARADQQPTSGCCSPGTRTICVTECVPETYQAKRISYTTEQRVEKYTAYKCEQVQEVRERTVCCNRVVTEYQDQIRKVCVKVPVCEDRTVMKPCYKYVTETKMVCKCVDRGHWECREEYSAFKAFCNHCSGFCGGNNCCCPPSNCVSRKCWVPCMVQEQCPVTCCRRVCEMHAEVVKVQCCRLEYREEKCKVCVTRCIPESHVEKYTCCVNRMVPVECTRTVCVSVPHEEVVNCTRMVNRQVMREVACCDTNNACCNNGCNTCASSCCNTCGHGCFHGLFSNCSLFRGCGSSCGTCNTCNTCNTGCSTGCGCGSSCGGWFSGCSLFHGCGSSCNTCNTGCNTCNTGCSTGCGCGSSCGGWFSGCSLFHGCGSSCNSGCCN